METNIFHCFFGTKEYKINLKMEVCKLCNAVIDCECMECHNCHPETICDTCGLCHIDMWEASACWSMENDPDYDPFDI